MITIHEKLQQGSPEWFAYRTGSIGASVAKNVLVGGKGKTRLTFMYQLIAEQLTGKKIEIPQNYAMKWGIETEPQARTYFELITGIEVNEVGLITNDEFTGVHCSPDGLISDNCGIEIKCPQPATHVKYLAENKLPPEYKCQVHFSMMMSGRPSWYFMSYHPDFEAQLILKIERDEKYIKDIKTKLSSFFEELQNIKKQILS